MIYTVTFNPSLDYIVSVPGFELGKTNRTESEQLLPGGKGINVSILLNHIGIESTALGFCAGFTGEEIKRQLPISSYIRPAWDLETLGKLGVNRFSIDLGISNRIYTKKDEFYNPTPMFLICGEKK